MQGQQNFNPLSIIAKIVAGDFSCRGIPRLRLYGKWEKWAEHRHAFFSGVSRVVLLAYLSF